MKYQMQIVLQVFWCEIREYLGRNLEVLRHFIAWLAILQLAVGPLEHCSSIRDNTEVVFL